MIRPDTTSLVDIHNHLVPGVDDGARNIPAVLDSIERMTRIQVRRIVTTPHIQGSLTLNGSRLDARLCQVGEAFEQARSAIKEEFPEVEFKRGRPVMITSPLAVASVGTTTVRSRVIVLLSATLLVVGSPKTPQPAGASNEISIVSMVLPC